MGETKHRGWDKELRAESPELLHKWEEARAGEQARWGQTGQASQRPLGPHPSPQALESRGSGQRDSSTPCSPQTQEFHQGGGTSDSVQVSSHWTDREPQLFLTLPPKPLGWPTAPFPPLAWLAQCGVCQALAENKPAGVGLQGAG
jgi:hypothetical protein